MDNRISFDTDKMDRHTLAEKWTAKFIDTNKKLVLAVNGQWGVGKTFFAKSWKQELENNAYKVCYIDVFEYDFTNDPFMVVSSEILDVLVQNKEQVYEASNDLHKSYSNIKLFEYSDIDENIDKTNSYREYKEKLINFRNKLEEALQQMEQPLIIMVDELDRCKPTFAVELLEKIKHIFDIDNIIFILFINEDELAKSICGIYGEKYDGKLYLQKFYNEKIELVCMDKVQEHRINYGIGVFDKFIKHEITKNLANKRDSSLTNTFYLGMDNICKLINGIHKYCNFSLRDIEKILSIIKYVTFSRVFDYGVCILIKIFSIKYEKLYNDFLDNKDIHLSTVFGEDVTKIHYLERFDYFYHSNQNRWKNHAEVLLEEKKKCVELDCNDIREYFNNIRQAVLLAD